MAQPGVPSVNVRYPENLDYSYRDVFKAFVGEGEVLLEFANINRSKPDEVTITDRIVLSIPNTIRLVQHLQESLKQAKDRFDAREAAASSA
jgi:hypothetical protein